MLSLTQSAAQNKDRDGTGHSGLFVLYIKIYNLQAATHTAQDRGIDAVLLDER